MAYISNNSDTCPHCGNNLHLTTPAHLYGSPFRNCPKCKGEYIDYRYHEIAIDGIREEDTRLPTREERKEEKKGAWIGLLIGIVCTVLFIVFLCLGLIVFPLPIGTIFGFIAFFGGLKKTTQKDLDKKLKALEAEKVESINRLRNPQYVEKLQNAGYYIPNEYVQNSVCSSCGSALEKSDKFCPKCGAVVRR